MYPLLLEWAKIAGVAGMAFGTVLLLYRSIINRLPRTEPQQAAPLLRLIIVLTFIIGALGIVTWAAVMIFVPEAERSAYVVDGVTDTLDFSEWTPVDGDPVRTPTDSIVKRTRIIQIRQIVNTTDPFIDRHTTTGKWIEPDFPSNDASLNQVEPNTAGRTNREYLLRLASESFKNGVYALHYSLRYCNGWARPSDNWVAKSMQYPTRNYKWILRFPSPWRSAWVMMQPPGATANIELFRVDNPGNRLTFEWVSDPNSVIKPGTRIAVHFDWPPLQGRTESGGAAFSAAPSL
jgi:hypothetical protein